VVTLGVLPGLAAGSTPPVHAVLGVRSGFSELQVMSVLGRNYIVSCARRHPGRCADLVWTYRGVGSQAAKVMVHFRRGRVFAVFASTQVRLR